MTEQNKTFISENVKNPGRGRDFEKKAGLALSKKLHCDFKEEPLGIGHPAKDHKFDLVCKSRRIVAECKRYLWTKTGNIPAGKNRALNETVLFLRILKGHWRKIIVMSQSFTKRRRESYAGYYVRIYGHLLENIEIFELNPRTRKLKKMN